MGKVLKILHINEYKFININFINIKYKILHINEVCTRRLLLRGVKPGLQPPISAGCCIGMNARNVLI